MSYIFIVVLFILLIRLNSRVTRVEESLKAKGVVQPPPTPMYASVPGALPNTQPVAPQQQTPTPVVNVGPDAGERFVMWLKEDWLLKLGALLLLIGFGWLTSYAFLHNWIGPFGRITLGIVSGLLILAFGWFRMRKYLQQGGLFVVLGAGVVLLTVFAAREMYGFFTPGAALAVMFGTTVFVGLASAVYRIRWVALMGLILASVAPLLTNSPTEDYVSLFVYLLVVTIGTLWLVAARGWRVLTTASLVIIAIYSAPILYKFVEADRSVLLLLMYAFTALFFVFTTTGIVKAKTNDISADIVTAGGSGLLLLWWIMTAASPEWQSMIIIAWMVVFLVGAFLVVKTVGDTRPFYVYSGVSIAMLGAATAAELSGAALTIAFAIEVALLYLIAQTLVHEREKIERLALLFIVPMILSGSSVISPLWQQGMIHKDFFVLLTMAVSLFVVYLSRLGHQGSKESSDLDSVLLVVGSVYAYVLLWLSLHALLVGAEDLATMGSLVVYTIVGITCYFTGVYSEKKGLKKYGGVLLAFVVGRLLIIDVWQMELAGRIITFFSIGILLMGTAFLGKKKTSISVPPSSI